jgi:hypothetical protein
MKQQQRGRSRRPEARRPGERSTLNMRIASELWHRLDQAARSTGRSLSMEAELRLEKSFDKAELLEEALDLAYGRHAAEIIMILAREMVRRGRVAGLVSGDLKVMENWPSDAHAYDMAAAAAIAVLEGMRPPGDPAILSNGSKVPDLDDYRKGPAGAECWVNETLAVVKDPKRMGQRRSQDRDPELERWSARRRERLGALTDQIHDFADEETLAPLTRDRKAKQ